MQKKQNKNLEKLFEVVGLLAEGKKLDMKYRDHDLSGTYKGTRECHIEPARLLVL
ncbi:type II toxin-antitoxin system mRNA interferase toxin, RelE/StbE family [Bulleidia sp. zg-1006]|uniref:type II toxin-antitoxin system mRNA interferase toxin, RelE/StbE family n=1 Tax=Bulleidia sp. zg-1006 TaxID=2806552 RepID=UPI001EEF2B2E|nr:type II toxin-antitoxin system mRNA interferase toxin, RelE/StbE family [Bulleidia sp. zg-1006]